MSDSSRNAVAKDSAPPAPDFVHARRPSMLAFLNDPANLFTLGGLGCGVLGIYFAVRGVFSAAMIAMLWAVFFDWFDGPIARRTAGRTADLRTFGGQLDSLVDIVSSGVCPAVVLLSYGHFNAWFLPGAFALIAAGAVRLSYFNAFGPENDSTFLGLSIDNNSILVPLVFLLERFVSYNVFVVTLYATIAALAILNVAPFRIRKMQGPWYFVITVLILGLTALYGLRLSTDLT
jgi:phosphatidylserine synthase